MKRSKKNFNNAHILIIGSGIIGKFNALELSKQGFKITIADPQKKKNSSSAALGLLIGNMYQKSKGRSWELRKKSNELWPKWIKFLRRYNNNLNITAQWSPFKDLVVDFNIENSFSENRSENYKVKALEYISLNPNFYGNFATSTILLKTAFKSSKGTFNPIFETFRNNRIKIANRLAAESQQFNQKIDNEGFPIGYGKNSQSVLIGAFVSAYSGISPDEINTIIKTALQKEKLMLSL